MLLLLFHELYIIYIIIHSKEIKYPNAIPMNVAIAITIMFLVFFTKYKEKLTNAKKGKNALA